MDTESFGLLVKYIVHKYEDLLDIKVYQMNDDIMPYYKVSVTVTEPNEYKSYDLFKAEFKDKGLNVIEVPYGLIIKLL